ncbi:hypothetical protein MNV49_002156 [Pseudohyphozyma bogoriensis]|nr:hypothetical protein MNV49_002156 [Pseudohyphozyma bogoriensis]
MSSPPTASGIADPFPISEETNENSPPSGPPPVRRLYASSSAKPFSKSAAKRQSVMALGSIKHLQHQFIKAGLTSAALSEEPEELEPTTSTSSAPPTSTKGPKKLPHLAALAKLSLEELPPSPAKPVRDSRMPWEKDGEQGKAVKGEKELRREVWNGIEDVCDKWGLVTPLALPSLHGIDRRSSASRASSTPAPESTSPLHTSTPPEPSEETPTLVLDLLQTTTNTIRTVQRYVVSLPSESLVGVGSGEKDKAKEEDGLQMLRKSSLEVLGALRDMEKKYRLPAVDGQASHVAEPSTSTASSDDSPLPSSLSTTELSTIALAPAVGEGFEYATSLTLADLVEETALVRSYVANVDHILFREREAKKRETKKKAVALGHRRTRAVIGGAKGEGEEVVPTIIEVQSPAGSEEGSSEDDDERPDWARKSASKDVAARAHAIIASHLPSAILSRLVAPETSVAGFWDSLSDGFLLSHAYNLVLRASSRPFGFIPEKGIHDLSVTKEGGVGATFRRVENLGVWAAALKFRYLLALDPPRPSATTSSTSEAEAFSAKAIARKEEGWKERLEFAVLAWAEKVVAEKREESE